MYLIVVYDTEKRNCAVLNKRLKAFLNWNQNSVFDGTVTEAQYRRILSILDQERAPDSHVIVFALENDKLLARTDLGEPRGNTSNIF